MGGLRIWMPFRRSKTAVYDFKISYKTNIHIIPGKPCLRSVCEKLTLYNLQLWYLKYWMLSKVMDKNYRDSLCFHKKVLKKYLCTQKYPNSPLRLGSSLCQVWKNWLGMSRHTYSQHWVLGHGVRISQFLSLIVFKISKRNERVF